MTAREYFISHGISAETLERFGVVADDRVITIPIKDTSGELLFRKYRHLDFDPGNAKTKKFSYDAGAKACLFNTSTLTGSGDVFLTEGEFDAMRLEQAGYHAVTNTSGAATFKPEWALELSGHRVFICYDTDEAGLEGAAKVQALLPEAIVLRLPGDVKDVCEFFQSYTKQEFASIVADLVKANTVSYQDVCDCFDKWLLLPDKHVIQILLATLVSHFLSSDPLWMFFVAPPSGSKTEIITTIASLSFCHMLSDLTPQTLASGMPVRGKMDPSLLSQLTNHVLIMKDFTTVLNMRAEDKAMILSQLREVYDGRYSKSFGTGKRVDWQGRLTFIAGVTSIIDTQSSIFQVMGERFVMYRIPQPDPDEMAEKAMTMIGKEKEMRAELSLVIRKYFLSLKIPQIEEVTLPPDMLKAISKLATFVVTARSGIVRDPYHKNIEYIPLVEAPTRLVKQLGTLLKSLAILAGHVEVTWDDYYLMLKVALDIIPANRMVHLVALAQAFVPLKTAEIAKETKYSRNGSEIILEDLAAVGLIHQQFGETWQLKDTTVERFQRILPQVQPSIDLIFPKNSFYRPLIDMMIDTPKDLSAAAIALGVAEL